MQNGPGLDSEQILWARGLHRVAGVDEVGRGALCGAVMAAAVILPPNLDPALLDGVCDSKRLTARRREALLVRIVEVALGIGIGAASSREIDRLNIARATALAMRRALQKLGAVEHVLVDGLHVRELGENQTPIVQGDARCLSIAAASIVAKQTRDRGMLKLASRYPAYAWDRNKGYGSAEHRAAMDRYGLTPHHRRTFGGHPQIAIPL